MRSLKEGLELLKPRGKIPTMMGGIELRISDRVATHCGREVDFAIEAAVATEREAIADMVFNAGDELGEEKGMRVTAILFSRIKARGEQCDGKTRNMG